ncbi:UL42 [Papio ursinus cytomegalovirus]|uniref:UL42 n=1 Tax=Papiine betaherpesvirus 4 TaxID=2560624 RepID=A0A0F7GA40_9BETA|nr:UL42 [Papio ursinus cytomegalovirus]AKG51621.1 UL42 [Papiine betaherpesvirus 4]
MSATNEQQQQQPRRPQQQQQQLPQHQQPTNDDAPPSYEEALGMATVSFTAMGHGAPTFSDDSAPPPYCLVVGEVPPRPDNFQMDMSDFPPTSHPPIEAYYEDGWKWTVGVFIIAILGIILLAVLVSVLMQMKSRN